MRIKLILAFVLFYTCCTTKTYAQDPLEWHNSWSPHFRHLNAIEILPNSKIIAIGGWEFNDAITTVLTSTDSCANWNPVMDMVNAILQDLDFSSATNGYTVGWAGNVWKSIDAGDNWTQITIPGNAGTRNYNGCHFFDDNTGIIVGGNESMDSIQTILKTVDGGSNWSIISDNLNPWLRAIHFADNMTGFTVGDNGSILKSVNGGDSWTPSNVPVSVASRRFNDVYFINPSVGIVVGGWKTNDSIQTILKTTDGGSNWTIVSDNLGSMLNSVHFLDANRGYSVGDDGVVLYTGDAGSTWQNQVIPNNNTYDLYAVNFKDEYFGVASGSDGKLLWYIDTAAGLGLNLLNSNLSEGIKLFPNPTSGPITIEFDEIPTNMITVLVVDITGKILSKNKMVVTENKVNINIKEISSQSCYVVVLEENRIHSFKTIVK